MLRMVKKMFFSNTIWLCLFIFLFRSLATEAQEAGMPKIIPPSPSAISSLAAMNNGNNFYTGKLSASVPLWNISTKNFQIPISLNYTAGSGIKLEEIPSWVGLGWSLTGDFSVSRVVNGFHDDKPKGYLSMDSIPPLNSETTDEYQEFGKGERDGQPDVFYFSLPDGEQGSFVFDFADNVQLKTKKNIKIDYTRDIYNLINDFTITGANGDVYYFTNKEKSFSVITDAPPVTDATFYTNSWFLTKMVNANRTDSVIYEYDQDTYGISTEVPYSEHVFSGAEEIKYSLTQYQSARVKKIIFPSGTVEYIPSSAGRKDVECCMPYLDKIIIKDNEGDTIRTVQFNYAYFAYDGNYNMTETITSSGIRLKLNSVIIYPAGGAPAEGLETKFEYDEEHRLPSRDSKSRDHWGYFNGKANTKLEHKRIVKIKEIGEPWVVQELGSADRSPDFEYAKTYLLTKIVYPTGGTSHFTFEPNRANSEKFDVKTAAGSYVSNAAVGDDTTTFTITSITSPQIKFRLRSLIADIDETIAPGQLVFKIIITRQSDSEQFNFDYYNLTDSLSTQDRSILLDPGNYTIQLQTIYNPNNMAATFPFDYINETPCENCVVGGTRIKSILNTNGAGQETHRFYSYETSPGVSSGSIMVIPEYGFYQINDDGIPFSYISTIHSNYPLTVTQGNTVGYAKITETFDELQSGGKTEYYFTTSSDHPDSDRGQIYYPCDDVVTFDGVAMRRYPVPVSDSRDFLRGLLLKKIDYIKGGSGELIKVKETETTYEVIKYDPCVSLPTIDDIVKNYTYQAVGLKGSWTPGFYIRTYELYGGYAMPVQTQETYFKVGEELHAVTTTDYGRNADDLIDFFFPRKQETVNGKGEVIRTTISYPADFSGTGVYSEMVSRNMIGSVVQQNVLNVSNTQALSGSRINYALWQNDNFVLPVSTQQSYLGNTLEDQLVIDAYDKRGNILQATKNDGVNNTFLWGYRGQYLVAQLTGIDWNTVKAYIDTSLLNTGTPAQINTQLNNLRSAFAGNHLVQVSTYTYQLLAGILTSTDPSGRTTFYEYDDFNRLSVVKDQDGRVLRKICYNYAGQPEDCGVIIYQSAEKSGNFTRNNCGSGYTGSTVTYTVPAGTYTSTISPEDADQQAQADVNANGQAYANGNGTCTANCSSGNCSGNDKKCVNGVCETGIRVNTDSYFNGTKWVCVFHYEWSDGSWSINYTELSNFACPY